MSGLGRWWELCRLYRPGDGIPYANAANVAQVLRHHPVWAGSVWYSRLHNKLRTDQAGAVRDWSDADEVRLLESMQVELGLHQMKLAAVTQGVQLVAHEHARHELTEYLSSFIGRWDGVPRIGQFAAACLGSDMDEYSYALSENLWLSLAARGLRPGVKADHVYVLEGTQGIGKSTVLRVIGGAFAREMNAPLGSKDAVLELAGGWVIELPEGLQLTTAASAIQKAFFSRDRDALRVPYGRHVVELPRCCVFFISTNECHYLRDSTGNRRYLPIRCGVIELAWLGEFRNQLIAEAVDRVELGDTWWEWDEEVTRDEQERRFDGDPWEEPIRDYLAGLAVTTMAEVLGVAVKIEVQQQDKRAQGRAAEILARLGWERRQEGVERRRVWRRRVEVASSGSPGSGVARSSTDGDQAL
jgi:predicted P-loop ATPase